jgi:hypothetical protein
VSTYRPVAVRVATTAALAGLLVIGGVVWAVLPADVRATVTIEQRVTIALAVLGTATLLNGLARSRVSTDADGLTVVNGYRTHRVRWDEVESIGIGRSAPWVELERTDGDSLMVMAVQSADGARAQSALDTLRAELAASR